MKEMKAIGKSLNTLADTVNRMKAPVKDAANVSNAQKGNPVQYGGGYGRNNADPAMPWKPCYVCGE